MYPLKTDKARDELRPGQRSLSQRERALLLLADGRPSMTDFSQLFGGVQEAGRVVQSLHTQGYLQWSETTAGTRTQQSAPTHSQSHETAAPAPDNEDSRGHCADAFDGNRSFATTRMFLFDLCERMFARRDPAQAERLRQALREARDSASMLAVADTLLAEIERHAGAERAASIRERIDKLLPAATRH